jgi:hypothetical protein
MKMAILFFYHHGSEGWGIFTISKCGAKLKILKCSKQTRSPFPQQSTLAFNQNPLKILCICRAGGSFLTIFTKLQSLFGLLYTKGPS